MDEKGNKDHEIDDSQSDRTFVSGINKFQSDTTSIINLNDDALVPKLTLKSNRFKPPPLNLSFLKPLVEEDID